MQERHSWFRLLCALLSVVLCCTLISCSSARRVRALDGEALEIHSFADLEVTQITVATGTHAAEIALPSVLIGYVQTSAGDISVPAETETADAETLVMIELEGEQSEAQVTEQLEEVEVPVTWSCEAYDPEVAGIYTFAAQLMENYTYSEEMPQIDVVVLAAESAATDGEETAEPTPTPEGAVTLDEAELLNPEDAALVPEAYQLSAFINEPIAIEVVRGTSIEDIPLPASLPAINALGEQVEVWVTWENITTTSDEMENDPNDFVTGSTCGYGPWVFTAKLAQPQIITTEATEGTEAAPTASTYAYSYTGEPVTARVTLPDCMTISNIGGYGSGDTIFRFVIFLGGSVALPDEITALMADGGVKNVPVSWSGSYDASTVGEYQLRMSVGGGYSSFSVKGIVSVIRNYALGEE